MARLTQKFTVKTMQEIAEFFGVTQSAVKSWRQDSMPGKSGCYDLQEIVQWDRHRPRVRNGNAPRSTSDQPSSSDRLRETKIAAEELRLAQLRGELVSRSEVDAELARATSVLRTAVEVLRRRHGESAAQVVDDALAEISGTVEVPA